MRQYNLQVSSAHLHITGKVQGVCYRRAAREMATKFGLTGWVRNCADGSVEIHAEGEEGAIGALERWCWEGPGGAAVRGVERQSAKGESCTSFDILPTTS